MNKTLSRVPHFIFSLRSKSLSALGCMHIHNSNMQKQNVPVIHIFIQKRSGSGSMYRTNHTTITITIGVDLWITFIWYPKKDEKAEDVL